MGIIELLLKYKYVFLSGLKVTMQLCVIVFPISIVIGFFFGYLRYKYPNSIGFIIKLLAIIISSTPILIFLFWAHYPFQYIFKLNIPPFNTSVFVISVVAIFLMSDYVSNSFNLFPLELKNTAKVLGFSNYQVLKTIQLPIILRQILPSIIMLFSFILQSTIFCSFISVGELFKKAQELNADIFKPIELYSIVAIFFIGICLFINLLAFYFKKKFTYDLNKY